MNITICTFSLVSPDRTHNQTLRLSNYFKRQETMQLLQTGHNFDDLVRGLITQVQKRADANIDKEVSRQHIILRNFRQCSISKHRNYIRS